MTLFGRVVAVAPSPVSIARSLADEEGFAFLWTAAGGGPSYVTCWPRERAASLDPEPSLAGNSALGPHGAVPRWIGVLPYEERRSLERPRYVPENDAREPPLVREPSWFRYGAVAVVDRDVRVVGDDRARVNELARRIRHPGRPTEVRVEPMTGTEPDAAHAERIIRALELIAEGEIYQVNLARRLDFRVTGTSLALLERLARTTRVPYAAALDVDGLAVASCSPELFLDVSKTGRLVTLPIKGTRPRGADAPSDARLVQELDQDPKERAELSMVIDVERNDLGRIAVTGSVRFAPSPRVQTYGSVHHRVARVSADLRPGVSRTALLEAMLPSGSVTGAPKIRAMEVIASLESARRGLYTGALGYLAHDGSLRLSMAIRTLVAQGTVGHYFSGGGIVLGSDPSREVEETRWKAAQLLRLLAAS